jgi:transposase-like protein
MNKEERKRRRFSEPLKRELVGLIEAGQLTVKDVSINYEVTSWNVRLWIKKYGKSPLPERIIIQSSSEVNVVKDLKNQINDLKLILADKTLEIHMIKSTIELYRRQYGVDLEKKRGLS